MLEIFGDFIITDDKDYLAVVGFAEATAVKRCKDNLQSLKKTVFRSSDPYAIDLTLVNEIKKTSDEAVVVIGATVRVHDDVSPYCPTGGVIGSPFCETGSAEEMIEELPQGILLFSRPGGPGFAAQCSRELAVRAVKALEPLGEMGDNGTGADILVKFFEEESVEHYIVISDGSSAKNTGAAIGRSSGNRICFRV